MQYIGINSEQVYLNFVKKGNGNFGHRNANFPSKRLN